MTELADIAEEVAVLDAILDPIANRPADINDPDWMERYASADLLAEAGIKPEVHSTLRALITHYAEGDEPARQTVRAIFERYQAFRWAAHIPLDPTPAGFRFGLLHFSAIDQGPDPRDAILGLQDLVADARDAGVDIKPILIEVAGRSSDLDRYGMGSTRQFLLAQAN